jgi:hypothetical protein
VIAAATEDDYDCENYDPGAVIVEEIAKAVVIHMFPPNAFWAKPIIILCLRRKKVSYFRRAANIFYKKAVFGGILCSFIRFVRRGSDIFFS